jgi:hypothetical protein
MRRCCILPLQSKVTGIQAANSLPRIEIVLFLEYLIAHNFFETTEVFSMICLSKEHMPSDTSDV